MLDDRQIKEMLQNAEEKAPRRIWTSVSSSLDDIEGRKVAAPVWKWAGAAIALAAALAVGVFVLRKPDETVNAVSEPVLAEAPVESVQENDRLESLKPEPVKILPSPKVNTELLAVSTPVGKQEDEIPASEPSETEVKSVEIVREAVRDEEMPVGDGTILDRMEMEDSRNQSVRRTDLIVGGSLFGNTASKPFRSSMSGGIEAIPSSDIIKETGASDFGVPFTVGVGVRFIVTPKFSIGTGLDYSLLTRTFAGTYTAAASTVSIPGDVRNTMHYIGIPLNLYYNIINSPALNFYVYGGGEGEYCVSNKYILHPTVPAAGDAIVSRRVDGLQFSAKIGVGVQFSLSDRVGLYLDPGVSYYFYGAQPRSIRTERPLMFNLNAGLRFDLGPVSK